MSGIYTSACVSHSRGAARPPITNLAFAPKAGRDRGKVSAAWMPELASRHVWRMLLDAFHTFDNGCEFAEAISTRVWESVGRANWRKFEEARSFVRGIGLKSLPEWNTYCQSGKKPNDIPSNPDKNYADNGWAGYGDWLGTGKTARGRLRPFKIARAYAHALGLKSQSEWRVFHRSGQTPRDIPINAHQAYADDGWAGWGDWLGHDHLTKLTSV